MQQGAKPRTHRISFWRAADRSVVPERTRQGMPQLIGVVDYRFETIAGFMWVTTNHIETGQVVKTRVDGDIVRITIDIERGME